MGNRPSSPVPLCRPNRSLAAVEWSLIMQCCRLREFSCLARCCKESLHAASTDFAGRFLMPLDMQRLPHKVPLRIAESSLLGCRKVHLRWTLPLPPRFLIRTNSDVSALSFLWNQPPPDLREFRVIGAIPRLTHLDCSHRVNVSPEHWDRLFALPSFQQLRILIVADVVPEKGIDQPADGLRQRTQLLSLVHQGLSVPRLLTLEFRRADSTSALLLTRPQGDYPWEMRLTGNTETEVLDTALPPLMRSGAVPRLMLCDTIRDEQFGRHVRHQWALTLGSIAHVRELVLEACRQPDDVHLEIAEQFRYSRNIDTVVTWVEHPKP